MFAVSEKMELKEAKSVFSKITRLSNGVRWDGSVAEGKKLTTVKRVGVPIEDLKSFNLPQYCPYLSLEGYTVITSKIEPSRWPFLVSPNFEFPAFGATSGSILTFYSEIVGGFINVRCFHDNNTAILTNSKEGGTSSLSIWCGGFVSQDTRQRLKSYNAATNPHVNSKSATFQEVVSDFLSYFDIEYLKSDLSSGVVITSEPNGIDIRSRIGFPWFNMNLVKIFNWFLESQSVDRSELNSLFFSGYNTIFMGGKIQNRSEFLSGNLDYAANRSGFDEFEIRYGSMAAEGWNEREKRRKRGEKVTQTLGRLRCKIGNEILVKIQIDPDGYSYHLEFEDEKEYFSFSDRKLFKVTKWSASEA